MTVGELIEKLKSTKVLLLVVQQDCYSSSNNYYEDVEDVLLIEEAERPEMDRVVRIW